MAILRQPPMSVVSPEHDLTAYAELLKRDGPLTMVGALKKTAADRSFWPAARD
jgi:hypothetical protein